MLILLISLFLYYQNRESTDDAQVDGHITQISCKVYGRVGEVLVNDNQQVKAGQTLVKTRSARFTSRGRSRLRRNSR